MLFVFAQHACKGLKKISIGRPADDLLAPFDLVIKKIK